MARHKGKKMSRLGGNGNGASVCDICRGRLDGQGVCWRCEFEKVADGVVPTTAEALLSQSGDYQSATIAFALQLHTATVCTGGAAW